MTKPFIIGISGGSGSGKTTLAKEIISAINLDEVLLLQEDAYYKDQKHLDESRRAKTNYDHPNAFDHQLLVKHLQALSDGQTVEQPIYDYTTHTRSLKTVTQQPAKVIILDGILLFHDEALRQLLDVKIFVDTDDDVRFLRRLQRDTKKRGRTTESVINQYLDTVKPMYHQFIEPTKRFANVIVPEDGRNQVAIDILTTYIKQLLTRDN